MKIHYNTTINDRKEIAQAYAERVGGTADYDKHTKTYVVDRVRFFRHGMIEGTMSKEEVDALALCLMDWEFADQASKEEYATMAGRINEYQIPDEPLPEETPLDEVAIEVMPSVKAITIVSEGFTEDNFDTLKKLIKSHAVLIEKSLDTKVLMVFQDGDSLTFPWFNMTNDEEQAAYYEFTKHLVDKAKTTKVVYEPTNAHEDEKYAFSKFLYRIGLDGSHRKTREILFRNLEGSAWKNLSWKKKKLAKANAEAEIVKEALAVMFVKNDSSLIA